ncbi:MAG: hypothetical protein KF902_12270 [Phycisphaeraceae bacterium]|nr:hypothetical protein [Phycisphaeraceae bacterium]
MTEETPSRAKRSAAHPARSRRARFAALAAAILLSATVCSLSLVRIGNSTAIRFDATATGEHRLSPRTLQIAEALPAGARIILALDKRTIEPGARQTLEDAISTFNRSGTRIQADWIDTSGQAGRLTFARTLSTLTTEQKDSIDTYANVVRRAVESLQTAAQSIDPALVSQLETIRDALGPDDPGRRAFDERAALFRVLSRDAVAIASAALAPIHEWDSRSQEPDDTPGPPLLDESWQRIRSPGENLDAQLDALARELGDYARSALGTPEARDLARGLAGRVANLRAPLARAIDAGRAAKAPAVIRVARLIEADRAAIVVGDAGPGIVAIDPDALIEAAASSTAEARARVESLFATALGTLLASRPPIVVLLHAENPLVLARANLYQKLIERLSSRGIDTVLWSLLSNAEPPSLRELNPDGLRRVVYIALSTDSSSRSPGPGQPAGIERAQRLGAALRDLHQRGEPLLISLSPSIFPATGSPDPTSDFLLELGLNAQTARPLVRERTTPTARIVTTPLTGADRIAAAGDHPIAGAISGLPLFMAWPIHIARSDDPIPGVRAEPLLTLRSDATWGESQWITLWQIGLESQSTLPAPPTRDARDLPPPANNEFTLAWAVERRPPDNPMSVQRLVIVGTHSYGQFGWFADGITHEQTSIDGRAVRTHPGNTELLDASIAYLAELDELIARSPEAGSTPVIRPIDPDRLRIIRLALALGMPGAILLIGAAAWIIRR